MKCENCNIEHSGSYCSGRFCSEKCAKSFSTKHKRREINEKISTKMKGRISWDKTDRICPNCETKFEPKRKQQKYCSRICLSKSKCSESAKKKIFIKIQERIKNGTFSGWKSRKDKTPSYPEQYFINLFHNENINDWERDHKVSRWFIDFAFIDKKIALEIDGKQHDYEDRKDKDKNKDSYLIKNGWNVIRIKWYNPINDNDKEKLYKQIEGFKITYNKNQYVK